MTSNNNKQFSLYRDTYILITCYLSLEYIEREREKRKKSSYKRLKTRIIIIYKITGLFYVVCFAIEKKAARLIT